MRILRLCSVYGVAGVPPASVGGFDAVGGTQVHTDRLTNELDARGIDQVVVTAYRPGSPRVEHLSTRTRVVRTGVPIRRFRQLYGIGALVQVARIARVDLVHAHLGEDLAVIPLARWAASRFGAGLVATVHCSLQHTLGVHDARSAMLRRLGGPMQHRLLREADLILVLSERLAERLVASGIADQSVRRIPLGVDLVGRSDARPPAMDARRWVVFAGRLVSEKGVWDLLEAFEQVSTDDVGLLLLGDGPERRSFEAAVRQRHMTGRVRFVGAVPHGEVAAYLRHAELAVLPSWFEERGQSRARGDGGGHTGRRDPSGWDPGERARGRERSARPAAIPGTARPGDRPAPE